MATIRKRGSKWQCIVRRDGRTASKSFTIRRDAVKWGNTVEAQADAVGGELPARKQQQAEAVRAMTVGDALAKFAREVSANRRSDSSGDVEAIRLRALGRSKLAALRIERLTANDVRAWRDRRMSEVQPSTVRREMTLLRSAVANAVGDDAVNVVALVSRPQADDRRERRLQPGEWQALLDACDSGRNKLLRPLIVLALETGMRRGELLAMQWRHVDLQRCTVFLPRTKSGHPRTVPLTPTAVEVMQRLPRNADNDCVLPLGVDGARHGFERVRARAGISDLRLHDLRHECISRLVERGLSLAEVQMVSGHRDVSMLLRYTHLQVGDVVKRLHAVE